MGAGRRIFKLGDKRSIARRPTALPPRAAREPACGAKGATRSVDPDVDDAGGVDTRSAEA